MKDDEQINQIERARLEKCISHAKENLDYLKEQVSYIEAELDSLLEELESLDS